MTIAVGAVSSLALSACSSSGTAGGSSGGSGGGGKSAAENLAAGVTKLQSGKAASFEISLQPDAAAIAVMNKDETDASAAAITQKLFANGGLDIKITVSADKALKDLKSTDSDAVSYDMAFKAGGTDLVDLRTVKGALYLKVDLPHLMSLSGQPASSQSPLPDSPELPPALKGAIQAVAAGKWVGISAADLKSVSQLAQTFGGGGDLGAATPAGPDQLQVTQFTTALMAALTKDATVTDKGNNEVEVTGKVKTLGQDVLAAVGPLLGSLPASTKTSLDKTKESLNSIPDTQTVTFDAWLSGGSLSELKIDLFQFAPAGESGGGHLPLDAKFSNSAPSVSAPDGVTNIDVQSVIGSLQGL